MEKHRKPNVILEEHGVPNASEYTNYEPDRDWNLQNFRKIFKIQVIRESEDERELEFDLIGYPLSFVNAFRRVLLSEVPSMAIEKVYIINNTSLIQDEVLAHRLGLIPLRADPRLFEYPSSGTKDEDEVSDQDTLRYELKVSCTWDHQAPKDSRRTTDMYKNSNVYSKDIKWVPIGRQAEIYSRGAEDLGVLEDDILLCKMRPGQEIHAFMHAVKGIGKDHAKFSPVATASYRLLPQIELLRPVRGEMAERLKNCFSPGVIEIVESRSGDPNSREARVKNARYDSCSRNVYQHEDLKNCVRLSRVRNHTIFTIESVGTLPPSVLFVEAVKILKGKCKTFLEELDNIGK
ncbi:DNA-directed RNA polymerases I and III subunit RPAC1 [Ceratina calcarata]|uniref:DNA-directed RNA polymerases I and III subunit RPAC1 n=1 Tax=Ceratina calcarata TaxID=156304 RepID=A0AAJ7N6L3_9HYME|nr:DNA-directed RNA polymerases I and III subunit RPAC1 [Ceratina calcarata]